MIFCKRRFKHGACVALIMFVMYVFAENGRTQHQDKDGRKITSNEETMRIPKITRPWEMVVKGRSWEGFMTENGRIRHGKKTIVVGIPTVKRQNAGYLFQTLNSLLQETSVEEMKNLTLVIFLADFDNIYNEEVLEKLTTLYTRYFLNGDILTIQVSKNIYPNMTGLERKLGDSDERVSWRSKQVVDCAILCSYVQKINAEYYLHLEDDVITTQHVWKHVKDFLLIKREKWTILEFSSLGLIGKLFARDKLADLSSFLLAKFNDMPVDWLVANFRQMYGQNERILMKPTLFQHIGIHSSFVEGNISKVKRIKDNNFAGSDLVKPDIINPKAIIMSKLNCVGLHSVESCYHPSPDEHQYFLARNVHKGARIYIVFQHIIFPKEIKIVTGNPAHPTDIIRDGWVEVSSFAQKINIKERTVYCKDLRKIASFVDGIAVGQFNSYTVNMKCMRILVAEDMANDLLISHMSVRARHPENNALVEMFNMYE